MFNPTIAPASFRLRENGLVADPRRRPAAGVTKQRIAEGNPLGRGRRPRRLGEFGVGRGPLLLLWWFLSSDTESENCAK